MRVLTAAFAAALVCAVFPLSEAHALDDAGYFAVADRLAAHVCTDVERGHPAL